MEMKMWELLPCVGSLGVPSAFHSPTRWYLKKENQKNNSYIGLQDISDNDMVPITPLKSFSTSHSLMASVSCFISILKYVLDKFNSF